MICLSVSVVYARFPQYSHTWCTGTRCTVALVCSFLVPFLACAPSYFVFEVSKHHPGNVLFGVASDAI